jgi:cellulose synthase (UDP-forming)
VKSRALAVGLSAVLAVHYLIWRIGSSLNLSSRAATALSLMLLAAELLLLASAFLQLLFSVLPGPDGQAEIGAAAGALAADRRCNPSVLPRVAVLVPSCGEPLEVVERSLRGCLDLDYPNFEVWLLDDGARQELRQLSLQLGCHYLARSQRPHAKAGNLNHALPHLQAELLAIFDADVVPLRSFLSRTVGLFRDPQVGFVQTPQTYMNADPVMRNLRLERWLMPDEESFYRWIQPNRQRLGAVVCAGTSFVMRLSSLRQVGGFETQTASEDLATGIRLIAPGYRGLYLPEKLSAGLAPFSLKAMARQRSRWASGTIQTLRTGANPLTIPGLAPIQRLAFLEGILHWCLVLPQLLLLLVPVWSGVWGILPYRLDAQGLLTAAFPFFLSQVILLPWLSGRSRGALMPELYRWVFVLPLAASVLMTLLGRPQGFQVTPKSVPTGATPGPAKRLLLPLLVLLAIQLASLFNLTVHHGSWPGPGALTGGTDLLTVVPTVLLTGIWGLINSLLLIAAIRTCWDRPRSGTTPWFPLQLEASLTGPDLAGGARRQTSGVLIHALSEVGCELEWLDRSPIDLAMPGALQELSVQAGGLAGCWPVEVVCSQGRRNGTRIGLVWQGLEDRQREQLHRFLYRRESLWPMRLDPFDGLALLALGGRLLQRPRPEDWFQRSQLPVRAEKASEPLVPRDRCPRAGAWPWLAWPVPVSRGARQLSWRTSQNGWPCFRLLAPFLPKRRRRQSRHRSWLRLLRKRLIWLWRQEGSHGQRARGLAAGVLTGCYPVFGLQIVLGIGLASLVRGNHLLAVAGTWISNPLTSLPLYWFRLPRSAAGCWALVPSFRPWASSKTVTG